MRCKNIILCKDKKIIKEIYYEAFPDGVRMPWIMMLILACSPTTRFKVYYDADIPCGFTYHGILMGYIFVMFFAVKNELRCCGYGGKILSEIRTLYPNHKILVTIEPSTEESEDIRTQRKNFYLRNGFEETGFNIKSFGTEQEILISG